jgi:hypothetical protein
MSSIVKSNIPASIRQRLFDLSKRENRPFGEVLQYYAMERFLFRLSKSKYADRFILKGALLLAVWRSEVSRSTMELPTMRAQLRQNQYLKMRCIEGFVFLLKLRSQ